MPNKLTLFVAAMLLSTTVARAQNVSIARKVFSSDSLSVSFPTLSPDEKWLVFSSSVSNQEMRLMIQPLAGGSPRELAIRKGHHSQPRFAPAGDRLLFLSNLPRRSATDDASYLMSVPFDTRTGTITGPARQISIDGVRQMLGWRILAISPDGQSVAYVGDRSNAIKLVPVNGGTARTIVEPPSLPARVAWSPDGKFLSYELAEGPGFARMRISREGGTSFVTARTSESMGSLSPDNEHSFSIANWKPGGGNAVRLFASNGQLVAEVRLPMRQSLLGSAFSVSGKYILGVSGNEVATVNIVPVAGGEIRQISPGTSYEWPFGWSADGELAYVFMEDQGRGVVSHFTRSGELKRQIQIPENADFRTNLSGFQDGHLIYLAGDAAMPENWRIMALSLTDGSLTQLAADVLGLPCCEPVGPGGMYAGITGGEFYYRKLRRNRLQLRAMRVGGVSRLIGEIPATAFRGTAVFQNRIVYRDPTKDSTRLQLVPGAGRPTVTLATFGTGTYSEFAWSYDGRQLAVSAGSPQTLSIYHFDDDGNLQGLPQVHLLPLEHWYEMFWLPDGSGLTMIAQPRAARVNEVALIKLADPQHPVFLTRDDPVNKWGHSLSPDGKFVSYASEQFRGSSIYLIDVAQLQMHAQMQKQKQRNK